MFYSLTHECCRVDYTGRYNCYHGYVDKHNRLHIGVIELKENVTFPERLRLRFHNRIPVKLRLSKILFNLSVKLNPPNTNAYRKAPKHPWWKY